MRVGRMLNKPWLGALTIMVKNRQVWSLPVFKW